jgi:hypothetical protein
VKEVELAIKNLTSVSIGKGIHYVQEDQPDEIGRQLSTWLAKLGDDG